VYLQESHCSQVQALAFNLCDEDCRNLFATVAKDQVRQLQTTAASYYFISFGLASSAQ
jgi:hypothetical protein